MSLQPRLVQFSVSHEMIRSSAELVAGLFDGLLVVKAEFLFALMAIEYTAIDLRKAGVPPGSPPIPMSVSPEFATDPETGYTRLILLTLVPWKE